MAQHLAFRLRTAACSTNQDGCAESGMSARQDPEPPCSRTTWAGIVRVHSVQPSKVSVRSEWRCSLKVSGPLQI